VSQINSKTFFTAPLLTKISFGWVNASYIYGMTLLSAHQRRALGALTKWDDYEKAMSNLGLN